jgi:Amt family ammonium transporter
MEGDSPWVYYDSEHFGLKGVLQKPSIGSPRVPSIVYCVFQLMFAAITYVIQLLANIS